MSWRAFQPRGLRVLLATRRAAKLGWVVEHLESAGYAVRLLVESDLASSSAADPEQDAVDLVVLDDDLLEVLGEAARSVISAVEAPVIIACSAVPDERAVDMLRGGAVDFISAQHPRDVVGAAERALLVARERRLTSHVIERSMDLAHSAAHRRRIESRLESSQRLEILGRLSAGIAHDFNNIITLVDGYASLLLDEVDTGSPLRADIEVIREAAARAARLVSHLSAFSHRQAGQRHMLRLDEVVSDLQPILERVLGEHFELELDSIDDLRVVEADAVQLEQVVLNLVLEGRDAMPMGGRLTVETFNERVDVAGDRGSLPPGEYTGLRVVDQRKRMDADGFAGPVESPGLAGGNDDGIGLGLDVVRAIIERHRGEIFVRRNAGQGTTLEFLLPASETGVRLQPDPQAADNVSGTETILVVEDDPPLRRALQRMLEPGGYRVYVADGGVSALAVADELGGLDLVICDVVMPDRSGREVVTDLLEAHPTLRAMYVSGYPLEVVQDGGNFLNERNFLHKPFTPQTLLTKVRHVLDADVGV